MEEDEHRWSASEEEEDSEEDGWPLPRWLPDGDDGSVAPYAPTSSRTIADLLALAQVRMLLFAI